MSNFSSISVAPQIAALAAQVTAVDAVVDAIRATDFPTTDALVTGVGNIVTDIHDVDLPVVDALVTANGVILADIHDTDLPAVITAIAAKELRGEFKTVIYDAAPGHTNWFDILNISGSSGKVAGIVFVGELTISQIRITIDSELSNEPSISADISYWIRLDTFATAFRIIGEAEIHLLNLEWINDFRVEAKQGTGANKISCIIFYQDDS